MSMKRRQFLKAAGLGAAGSAAIAAPAIAQSAPEIKWRLASTLPEFARHDLRRAPRSSRKRVARRDRRQVPDPGVRRRRDRARRFGVVDAVQNGTVECCAHRAVLLLRQGPDVRVRLRDSVRPELRASRTRGCTTAAACELMSEFFKDYNIINFPAGNTGAQMGGWFRKEIKTVADLKGLKMRIGGFARQGHRRSSASCRSRSPAATSIRRSKRARSTRPNGSARTTTRSSASTRSRRTTTTRAGGKAARARPLRQHRRRGTSCRRTTRRSSRRPAAKANVDMLAKYDCAQPGGAEAPGRRRREAAAVLERRSWRPATRRRTRSTTRSRPRTRSSRRSTSRGRLPQRADISGSRSPRQLRQLHDRQRARGADRASLNAKAPARAGAFLIGSTRLVIAGAKLTQRSMSAPAEPAMDCFGSVACVLVTVDEGRASQARVALVLSRGGVPSGSSGGARSPVGMAMLSNAPASCWRRASRRSAL